MPNFKIKEFELKDADFETVDDVKMPRALSMLLGRLGSCFFQFDNAANQFIPTPDAAEICKIVERSIGRAAGISNEELAEHTKTLVKAIKAAYDRYAALPGAVSPFRPVP